MYRYYVSLAPAKEGGFVVTLPAFPEIVTQGESVEDALAMARDAVDEALANRLVLEEVIPKPDARLDASRIVEASPYITLKVALHEAMRAASVSKSKLGRMLDVGETEVRRMLDPRHATKFQRLTEALHSLGARVRVEVEHSNSKTRRLNRDNAAA